MTRIRQGRSAYDTALDYLTSKDRTVREIENRLDEGNFSETEISDTVEKLKKCGLIDDARYAHNFVESRLNTKPVSKQKLRMQLAGHFIDASLIDEALQEVSDETEYRNAAAVADKYYRQFSDLDEEERIRRVGKRLISRGYTYDCIKKILEELPVRNEDNG